MAEVIHTKRQCDIIRSEANFDRACDEAYDLAIALLGIDEDWDTTRVKGWCAKRSTIRIEFHGYYRTPGEHVYKFTVTAFSNTEEDDDSQ